MARTSPPSHICVIGDAHGHLQLALLLAARWQEELELTFDAVLLAGDVGTFPSTSGLDKATRRHAEDNPCEIEFATQWMTEPPAPHLARIFRPLRDNGLGLDAPVVMVMGNHEGFDHLESIMPRNVPANPVAAHELPIVDRGGHLRLLPNGWTCSTPAGLRVGGLGGIQSDQRGAEYHRRAHFTADEIAAIRQAAPLDILLTHTGPNVTQPFPRGATDLDQLANGGIAGV